MARIYGTLLVLLTTLLNVPVAESGTIVYFDSYRSLSADGQLSENTTTGEWSSSRPGGNGSAEHRSNISQSGISAVGNIAIVSNTPGAPGNHKSTELFTSFEISEPYFATLAFGLTARDSAYTEGFLFDQNTQMMLAHRIGSGQLLYDGDDDKRTDGVTRPHWS